MKRRKQLLFAAATAALPAVHAVVCRAEYAVIDLGAQTNVAGSMSAKVTAINAAGQVTLTNSPDGTVYHGYLYNAGSTLDLGTLGGANSYAEGINGAGQVVGRSTTTGGVSHAFLWTPGGTSGVPSNPQMVDLIASGGPSEATGINSTGQIVGNYATSQFPFETDSAYIYSNGTVMRLPLPTGGGYTNSYAYAINDSGHAVGAAFTALSPLADGFFYDGSRSTRLGTLGGGSTMPLTLNNSDAIAGYSTTVDGYDHAFLSTSGTVMDLGTLGGHYSYAIGINNHNSIVGGSFTDFNDSIYHAFIDDGTTMTDLNSLITSRASSWVLNEADAVNDNGVIVGTGTLSGQQHAFMLKPLVAGDANADGIVNFSDLLTLAQHYNQTGATWEEGDFNGDGIVNFSDLLALAQHYNQQMSLQATLAAVPEPVSGAAALVAGLALLRRRRA